MFVNLVINLYICLIKYPPDAKSRDNSDVISDYFADFFETKSANFIGLILDDVPTISFITQIELLSRKTDANIENGIKDFRKNCYIKNINPEIISHCVKVRRINKLKTPDSIIVGNALAFGLTIITNNSKDFSNIKSLKTINPYSL